MKARASLAIGLTGLLSIGSLVGCASPDTQNVSASEQYSQVCQDKETNIRVEDSKCNDGDSRSSWSYLPASTYIIPAVGMLLVGASLNAPRSYRKSIPSSGYDYKNNKNPVFDNSKFLPVPGDFDPSTKPTAPDSDSNSTTKPIPTKAPKNDQDPSSKPLDLKKPTVKPVSPEVAPPKAEKAEKPKPKSKNKSSKSKSSKSKPSKRSRR